MHFPYFIFCLFACICLEKMKAARFFFFWCILSSHHIKTISIFIPYGFRFFFSNVLVILPRSFCISSFIALFFSLSLPPSLSTFPFLSQILSRSLPFNVFSLALPFVLSCCRYIQFSLISHDFCVCARSTHRSFDVNCCCDFDMPVKMAKLSHYFHSETNYNHFAMQSPLSNLFSLERGITCIECYHFPVKDGEKIKGVSYDFMHEHNSLNQ